MSMRTFIKEIQQFIGIEIHHDSVEYEILDRFKTDTFERQLIRYPGSESDEIRAYLFIPILADIRGSILIHHQHAGERHLGKSEVAGLVGDAFQFFCPTLASNGFICLAPDSICFEDRRRNMTGFTPADDEDDDHNQHYNEMCYRLLRGELLMKKVIEDSSIGISLLSGLTGPNQNKIGILGHS